MEVGAVECKVVCKMGARNTMSKQQPALLGAGESLAYVHWPHFYHGPFGLAVLSAAVGLHVAPGELQIEDSIEGLLIRGLCFQFTSCMYWHVLRKASV